MWYTVFKFGGNNLIIICTLLSLQLHALNEFITDGDSYWNSTSDFVPIQNASYGTIKLKTALSMSFSIIFNGKSVYGNWENVFRLGHSGHLSRDFKCSKNDRFPAMWIDAERNAFVFDLSDNSNCFRQYASHAINPYTLYNVMIVYNSSWIYISINNEIITNSARINSTSMDKLNSDIYVYISTVTSVAANATLSNIIIRSYHDITTLSPSISPSLAPTQHPTLSPTLTVTAAPTKKPTTFLPTVYTPYIDTTDMDTTLISTYIDILSTYSNKEEIISNKSGGLTFEFIFYILTGCAMGGILFCVCTCCCFGCVINKKIKNLAANDDDDGDDEEEEEECGNMIDIKGDIEGKYGGNRNKLRVNTVSAEDQSHSVNVPTATEESATQSPTINRLSSPSSAISNDSFDSPSDSIKITPKCIDDKDNGTIVDLGSNRPRFSKKFHSRLSKLAENDERHKLKMSHSVPIMDPNWSEDHRNIKIKRTDTVIEIETKHKTNHYLVNTSSNDSLYSKHTSNQPSTHYSLFVHKPRSPLILDMNKVNLDQEEEKTSTKHYQIQIDYANSEQMTQVKSIGDIEMDSTHKSKSDNTQIRQDSLSLIPNNKDIDIDDIDDIDIDIDESAPAKAFLALPANADSRSSNHSNSSSSTSCTSSSTDCSSSECSSSSNSSSDCSTSSDDTSNATLKIAINDDITSNISGSSAYYSNAEHSYVD